MAANVRRPSISTSFIENFDFLKRFLARYFSEQQDIEDVVQETYLRAYGAEQKKVIDHPRAFLFQIAKNLALTELKKKSRQITDYIDAYDLPLVIGQDDPVQGEVEAKQNIGLYCEAVAALPEQCRRVFLLRKVHGLSHKEISERMQMTISAVEKHMLKGVLKCRAYVQERETGRSSEEAMQNVRAVTIAGKK